MFSQAGRHVDHSPERHDPVPYSEAEWEWQMQCRNSLDGGRRSAMRTAFVGSLAFLAVPIVIFMENQTVMGNFSATGQAVVFVTMLLFSLLFVVIYSFAVGVVAGTIAHRFTFGTTVPVSRLAIAIAWVANLSLWGWLVVWLLP